MSTRQNSPAQPVTRTGKIARLPHSVRAELNRRLADGKMGKRLVDWLNAQPEVKEVLAAEFGGRAITEQNLSEWKQGGFADWLRQEEEQQWARTLAEEAECLEEAAGDVPLAEGLAFAVLTTLGRVVRELQTAPATPELARTLLAVAQQIALLRRADAEAERVELAREQWDEKLEETLARRQTEAHSKATSDLLFINFLRQARAAAQSETDDAGSPALDSTPPADSDSPDLDSPAPAEGDPTESD